MENLNEYILRYRQYKEGYHEYYTITSTNDIKKMVENGKKIVFIGRNHAAIPRFMVGGIFLITGFIVSLIASSIRFDWIIFISILGFTAPFCIFFFILGLWYRCSHFLVLGPEGIAYKLRNRGIKGYKWEYINMDFYNFSYIKSGGAFPSFRSLKINIFMPNGDYIKVEPPDFTCKEIMVSKYNVNKETLIMLIFATYYNYGKNKTIKWQAENTREPKKKTPSGNNVISTDMVVIDTWRDQLKEAMYNYKKKKNDFSKISTSLQIHDCNPNPPFNTKTFFLKR